MSTTKSMAYVTFGGLILDLLSFTLILPLFPSILDFYSKHELSEEGSEEKTLFVYLNDFVNETGEWLGAPKKFNIVLFGGLLGSMFSFLQFIVSPFFGGLSDMYGRRKLLLISLFGITISHFVWMKATTFPIFFLARIIGGISKGNISISTSIMIDIFNVENRTRGMALIGIAFSLGFIFGPMIGAASLTLFSRNPSQDLDSFYWFAYPATLAFALSGLNFVYTFLFFEETLTQSRRQSSLSQSLSCIAKYINPYALFTFSSLKGSLNDDEHRVVCQTGATYFLYLFFYSGLEFTLTFLTHTRFNFTSMEQGKMFLVIGTLMALIQGGYVRKLKNNQKVLSHVKIGLFLVIPSFIIVGIAQNKLVLYIGLILYAASTSVSVPCMTTIISLYGGSDEKGIIMGVLRSLGALARAFGPIFSCIGYWIFGPEIAYIGGGLFLILPLCLAHKIKIVPHKNSATERKTQ